MGRAANWFKKAFGSAPKVGAVNAPNANQLYSGPSSFGDWRASNQQQNRPFANRPFAILSGRQQSGGTPPAGYRPEGANVTGSPEGTHAAQNALRGWNDLVAQYQRPGLTPEQQGQFNALASQGMRANAATRQAAVQGAAARGGINSGAGMLAGLAGTQADANAQADASAQFAAMMDQQRQANLQQSLGAQGAAGLGLDAQQFGQNAANAGAMDAFNQWAAQMEMQAKQNAFQNQLASLQDQAQRQQALNSQYGGGWRFLGGLASNLAGPIAGGLMSRGE